MSNERRAPASWPTDDMVGSGAEVIHDSLRMFGIDINLDTETTGTEIQQEIVEAVFNAMLAAAPKFEPVQEPAAQVSIDADGGNKRLTWYSHKAMRETPEWTKLYAAPQPVSDDALMSAVGDVIDHLNGGFSIHSGQGLHSCLEAAYRAAMGSK